jgi:hypothetical protein
MTFSGNASAQAAVTVEIDALKHAMCSFAVGICSILLALLVSFTFTAAHPTTAWHKF